MKKPTTSTPKQTGNKPAIATRNPQTGRYYRSAASLDPIELLNRMKAARRGK